MADPMRTMADILVVKLGGTEGVDFSAICSDVAGLLAQGQQDRACTRRFCRGQRAG